jgi:LPS-assembly protein
LTRAALTALALLFFTGASLAATFSDSSASTPVNFLSGNLEVTADAVKAEGEVKIEWGERVLTARTVTYDRVKGEISAGGGVTISDTSGNRIKCESVRLNVDTLEGDIFGGELYLAESGYTISAKKLQRTGEFSYRAEEASFTACEKVFPSWTIDADWMEVEIEGYLTGGGGVFRIEKVPAFYLPYFFYPVKLKRQSGLLPPKVGYSGTRGFEALVPFYYAFADNADLLLTLGYMSEKGWSEDARLRYILAAGHEGELDLKFLQNKDGGSNRVELKADHNSRFSEDKTLDIQIDYVTDKDAYRALGNTLEERGVSLKRSRLYGAHTAGYGTYYGLGLWTESFRDPQDEILQKLPSIGFMGRDTPVWGPLFSFTEFSADNFTRNEGVEGQRYRINQGFSLGVGDMGAGAKASAGYRYNYYSLEDGNAVQGAPWAELSAHLALYDTWGGWTHIVEPFALYRWDGRGKEEEEAPFFDHEDIFEEISLTTFGLKTSIVAPEDGRDFLSLDVRRPLRLTEGDGDEGVFREWLPLRGEAELRPFASLRITGDGEYDTEDDKGWLRWASQIKGSNKKGDELYIARRFVKDEADYIDGGFTYGFTDFASLHYRNRYSQFDKKSLETTYALLLKHPCWEMTITHTLVYLLEKDRYDHRTYLTVTLAGLDKLGKFSW